MLDSNISGRLHSFVLAVSIGLTGIWVNLLFDDVVRNADKALFSAKENGRDRVESIPDNKVA